MVNGVGQTDADLADALASGALVNAESLGALEALLRAPTRGRIGLRVNPALDAGTHPHLATGSADAKFGIALDELPAALGAARDGRRSRSARTSAPPSPMPSRTASWRPCSPRWQRRRERNGSTWAAASPATPEALASAIRPHLPDAGRLIVEPGRSIVARAGWLLTRVVRVQARGHLVADAGMTELLRPMLYGARHPVTLLSPGAAVAERSWTLSGPVCEAGDVLARDVDLGTEAGEGALLAIGEVGAYGVAMASGYNGRLRPAQVVIEGGELRLEPAARDARGRGRARRLRAPQPASSTGSKPWPPITRQRRPSCVSRYTAGVRHRHGGTRSRRRARAPAGSG